MNRPKNFRAYFVVAALGIGGIVLLLREHRPSFLRPDLHLSAYVTTADGNITVVDLVKLKTVARIPVGPGLSGMREHPTRPEVFGVSSAGGYVWILDPRFDPLDGHFTGQITARIAVGPLPYALDFSPDGKRSLVVNRRGGSLGMHDARTLALRGSVSVVAQPADVAVLPDSSLAFVLSHTERRLSVVDLRRDVLLTNLELAGVPTDMLLKPDGGELYVISPEAHGLQAINTSTHEVGDYMVLGSAPTRGVLSEDATLLYVSDTAAGRVTPVDIYNRRIVRDPGKGFPVPAGDSPAALRFDPAENLLLVVSQGSGDLAVIRVRTNFLLTLIPVGDHPQNLAVKLF